MVNSTVKMQNSKQSVCGHGLDYADEGSISRNVLICGRNPSFWMT